MDLARGLGLANLLTDDTARRRQIVAQWARVLGDALTGIPAERLPPSGSRPLAGPGRCG
jgi:hypothetical protein